jgi:hypothetical protein
MNMLVLLTHLPHAAKQYQRQIVHCGKGLSGNAISTLSMKLQATFESALRDAEGASDMPGLALSTCTTD